MRQASDSECSRRKPNLNLSRSVKTNGNSSPSQSFARPHAQVCSHSSFQSRLRCFISQLRLCLLPDPNHISHEGIIQFHKLLQFRLLDLDIRRNALTTLSQQQFPQMPNISVQLRVEATYNIALKAFVLPCAPSALWSLYLSNSNTWFGAFGRVMVQYVKTSGSFFSTHEDVYFLHSYQHSKTTTMNTKAKQSS